MTKYSDFFSGKSILVTGGRGFIGAALVRALAQLDIARIVVAGRVVQAPFDDPRIQYMKMDLTDAGEVQCARIGNDYDVVFHCAGVIDQSVRPGIYHEQYEIHLGATLRLLALTRGSRLCKFVQVGSNAEYGVAPVPHSADGPCMPNSAYGASKLSASHAVIAQSLSEGVPAVVVRPFLVYGKGMARRSLLGLALEAARCQTRFPTSPGLQTRDFVSISKVVTDLLHAAADPDTCGRIVNSCTGDEQTVRSVLERIAHFAPGFIPDFGGVPYRPTELMASVGVPYIPIAGQAAIEELDAFILDDLNQ